MTEDIALIAVRSLIEYIGEDSQREGLRDTPQRVVKMLDEITSGYGKDPRAILSVDFPCQAYDEMVILRQIPFCSTCEHHLMPFIGTAAVGYVPRARVVGLSKLARLVECFARRLQIQEQMTAQIADAIEKHLKPRGVGVLIEANHLCMACRGVNKNSTMSTVALRGVFKKAAARAEFLAQAR